MIKSASTSPTWSLPTPERRDGRGLLALRARAEIAEGQLPRAARTVQTGLSFSRHVGDGPFFIHVLLGTVGSRFMLDQIDDLIGQPRALPVLVADGLAAASSSGSGNRWIRSTSSANGCCRR